MTSHQQPPDPLSVWQAHLLIWICHRAPRTAARAQATATFQICWQAHATHRHRFIFLSLKAEFILVLPRQNPIWSRRAASLAGWSNKCTDDQLIHLLLVKHNARINLSTCTARFFNDREGKTDGAQKGSSHRQPPIWNSGPVLIGRILTIITVALIMFCLYAEPDIHERHSLVSQHLVNSSGGGSRVGSSRASSRSSHAHSQVSSLSWSSGIQEN